MKRELSPAEKPLWTCPKCGERFVSVRLWHSCGRHSYDALFARSEPHVRRIFERLAEIARSCGPVRIYPQKTRIVMQARIRNVSRHYIAAYVPLRSEDDVDAEVKRWMKRAYRFGCQEHLSGPRAHGPGPKD